MNLDWAILNGIRDHLACPALDSLMPKITALGNGGAIWLIAAALLCTEKPPERHREGEAREACRLAA